MIIGIDNGYAFTKTSEGVIFPSTIKAGVDIDINKDSLNIAIDGVSYVVGANNGQYVADSNKIDSLITEVCTFAAIAKSFPDKVKIETKVVVGLPIAYYSSQKVAFKEKLMKYGTKEVKINGESKIISITDVIVYPQSAGVVFLNTKDIKKDDTLVIDIGGATVDISFFQGLKLSGKATYPLGMMVLHSELVQRIVAEHDVNLEMHQIDEKLEKGYITTPKGKVDLSEYDNVINAHVIKIANNIKTDFKNYNSMDNTFIVGGGGIRLMDKIGPLFNNSILVDNAQFVNANAFKLMGDMQNK